MFLKKILLCFLFIYGSVVFSIEKNYYEILGVLESATEDEIKTAYRKRAKESHPDIKGGDASLFRSIHEAYEVLRDKTNRQVYDQSLKRSADNPISGVVVPFGDPTGVIGLNKQRREHLETLFKKYISRYSYRDSILLSIREGLAGPGLINNWAGPLFQANWNGILDSGSEVAKSQVLHVIDEFITDHLDGIFPQTRLQIDTTVVRARSDNQGLAQRISSNLPGSDFSQFIVELGVLAQGHPLGIHFPLLREGIANAPSRIDFQLLLHRFIAIGYADEFNYREYDASKLELEMAHIESTTREIIGLVNKGMRRFYQPDLGVADVLADIVKNIDIFQDPTPTRSVRHIIMIITNLPDQRKHQVLKDLGRSLERKDYRNFASKGLQDLQRVITLSDLLALTGQTLSREVVPVEVASSDILGLNSDRWIDIRKHASGSLKLKLDQVDRFLELKQVMHQNEHLQSSLYQFIYLMESYEAARNSGQEDSVKLETIEEKVFLNFYELTQIILSDERSLAPAELAELLTNVLGKPRSPQQEVLIAKLLNRALQNAGNKVGRVLIKEMKAVGLTVAMTAGTIIVADHFLSSGLLSIGIKTIIVLIGGVYLDDRWMDHIRYGHFARFKKKTRSEFKNLVTYHEHLRQTNDCFEIRRQYLKSMLKMKI